MSDIEKTAELLAKSGARVPDHRLGRSRPGRPRAGCVRQQTNGCGTRMPKWSRAWTKARLAKLSGKSPHVTYYPARTRPFDLVPLYQKMISRAAGDVVVGELRQVRYTEGYPYLLGLAVALWLAASPWRLAGGTQLAAACPAVAGLRPASGRRGRQAAFQAKFQQGGELLQHAQEQSAVDLSAARSLLLDAREAFLRAALLRPGDIETARQITAVTRRLREVEAAIEKQRAEDKKRREDLAKIIERLREAHRAPGTPFPAEFATAAPPPRPAQGGPEQQQRQRQRDERRHRNREQQQRPPSGSARRHGTAGRAAKEPPASWRAVTSSRTRCANCSRGPTATPSKPPPTELDPAADLLAGAVAAQQQALASLAPGPSAGRRRTPRSTRRPAGCSRRSKRSAACNRRRRIRKTTPGRR